MPKKKASKPLKKTKLVKKTISKKVAPKKSKLKLSHQHKVNPNFKINLNPHSANRIKALIGFACVLAGIFLLSNYIKIHNPKASLNFNIDLKKAQLKTQDSSIKVNPALMKDENVSEEPIRIVMPSAKIDLNVVEAPVVDGYWETSETTASHGMGSANPGQKGNSVIFAHAREGLFYNLKDLQKDDVVYVFTDKKWYPYKVTDVTSVYPNQIEVIAPTTDQRLTLYTCTGYADEQRLIVVAKPLNI